MTKKDTDIQSFLKELSKETKQEIQFLTSSNDVIKEGLSTGSLSLNMGLSGNPLIGFVKGRIVEVYGPEQSGKTTLMLECVAQAHKLNWATLYIDAEHALDPKYTKKIGVDLSKFGVSQPDSAEECLDLAISAAKKGIPLIVLDSIAAMAPLAEINGKVGDAHVGVKPRLMNNALRQLVSLCSKSGSIMLFVNQIRQKIGLMFGSNETTPGGLSLKFAASYRIEVRSPRGGAISETSITDGKNEIGIESKFKIIKNKLYPPYKTATAIIKYGEGYDKISEIVDYIYTNNIAEIPKDSKLKTPQLKLGGKWYKKKEIYEVLREPKMFDEAMKYVVCE